MKIILIKTPHGYQPHSPETIEWDEKNSVGEVVHADFKKMRNAGFHRKLFALLQLAFQYWEPGEIDSKYGTPQKNFDRFRKDLIILAGFYNIVVRLDGSTRIEAQSISFGSMDNNEFEKMYNKVLDVILAKIPVMCSMSKKEIDLAVEAFLHFG